VFTAPGRPLSLSATPSTVAVPVASSAPAPASSVPRELANAPQAHARRARSALTDLFVDSFERSELGPDYYPTSPVWRIESGRLCGSDARNHPVWLLQPLPVNARIEFDAVSQSPEGDLKVEVWGDGMTAAKGTSYSDATSYLAIYGGWKNTKHLLARLDEHAPGVPGILVDPSGRSWNARPVVPNHAYHFKIERNDGRTIRWLVDDIELVAFPDPEPLKGPGHRFLGFNDWQVPVCFDDLKITPLPGE
jgi:hypothetical protein